MGAEGSVEILLVDDDASIRILVHEILTEDGFNVSTADNGVEAIAFVRGHTVGAIVMDLQMPLMDGRTFFRALRALPSDTPVLLLSAHGVKAAQHELGAEDALAKPFDPDVLVERVRRLVEVA